jgi:hypothetical protein
MLLAVNRCLAYGKMTSGGTALTRLLGIQVDAAAWVVVFQIARAAGLAIFA